MSLFVVFSFLLKYLNSAHNFHMQNTNISLKSMPGNSTTLSISEFVVLSFIMLYLIHAVLSFHVSIYHCTLVTGIENYYKK